MACRLPFPVPALCTTRYRVVVPLVLLLVGLAHATAPAVHGATVSWYSTSFHLDLQVLEDHDVHAGNNRSFEVGDFNGDGYDDLAVGIPDFPMWTGTQLLTNVGVVQVLYGGPAGLEIESRQVFREFYVNDGETPSYLRYFGLALATGDFDADGVDDLAVGSEWNAYVLPGNARAADGSGGLSVRGSYSMPIQVSFGGLAAGDFNGDWYTDLAIASHHWFEIYFGTSALPLTTNEKQRFRTDELHPDAGIFFRVRSMDLDGDVFSDLVVRAGSWAADGLQNAGALFVMHGTTRGFDPGAAQIIHRGTPFVPGAPRENEGFPATMRGARLHGPHQPMTLLLGNSGSLDSGELLLIPTSSTGLDLMGIERLVQSDLDRKETVEPREAFAEHIVALDLDGDGFEEIGVSSRERHAGNHSGQITFAGFDPLTVTPTFGFRIESPAIPSEPGGYAYDVTDGLASGDFDGDGVPELIVASRNWMLPGGYRPRARAFHVLDIELVSTP